VHLLTPGKWLNCIQAIPYPYYAYNRVQPTRQTVHNLNSWVKLNYLCLCSQPPPPEPVEKGSPPTPPPKKPALKPSLY